MVENSLSRQTQTSQTGSYTFVTESLHCDLIAIGTICVFVYVTMLQRILTPMAYENICGPLHMLLSILLLFVFCKHLITPPPPHMHICKAG